MAERIYVTRQYAVRILGIPRRRRRWHWHVRYRVAGQHLVTRDKTVDGRAWTRWGARWALRRWLRRREVVR